MGGAGGGEEIIRMVKMSNKPKCIALVTVLNSSYESLLLMDGVEAVTDEEGSLGSIWAKFSLKSE